MSFFGVTTNVILPIVIIVGLSALVAVRFKPDPRPLSSVAVYLFAPFLIFDGMARADIQPVEFGKVVLLSFMLVGILAVLGLGLSRLMRFDRQLESAFLLTIVLLNGANYGLPLNEFAYGLPGMERAMVYFVTTTIITNTVGVFLASRGTASPRQALLNMVKVPLLYGLVLGLIVNFTGVTIPLPIQRVISLLAAAAVPFMMAVMGIQLTRARIHGHGSAILVAAGMRLIISPIIAMGLVVLLGIPGLMGKVSIVQSAMPTAVMAGVLATQFDSDAEFTSSVILVTTLLSVFTLNVLLTILG